MNFVTFIDNRFQELQVEMGKEGFSIGRDGEASALQLVLGVYRALIRFAFIPKVLVDFILFRMGIREQPLPALENLKAQAAYAEKMAQEESEAKDKAKLGKKYGFNTIPLKKEKANEPA